MNDVPTIRDFGAQGDGKHNDTPHIQAAVDSLQKPPGQYGWSTSGGTLGIPPGRYRTEGPVDIIGENIQLVGGSGPSLKGRSTWIEHHGDGPLFRFPSDTWHTAAGFLATGFVMVAARQGEGTAFEIHTGDKFRGGMRWDGVGMGYFREGISVVKRGAMHQVGLIKITDCMIQWGGQAIAFQGSTSCNILQITQNNITQNGHKTDAPVLKLRAFSLVLTGNDLEGQRNAVRVAYSKSMEINSNWFEGNETRGDYSILVERSQGIEMRMNHQTGNPRKVFHVRHCDDVVTNQRQEMMDLYEVTNHRWAG